MYNFDYVRPVSVADALAAHGGESVFLAGGQTLLPAIKQRLNQPPRVVDLSRIADLKGISAIPGGVRIGATTTHAEVAASGLVRQSIPALAKLAGGIGDPQVRHTGTIGGSLANNDPAADYPAGVLGLGATIVTNQRRIAADDYFQGMFTTALAAGELIVAVEFPTPERAGYAKFEQRASRYALVGVMVAKRGGEVRVAVTGAGAGGVFRATALEAALARNFSPDVLAGIALSPDDMNGDIHGSAEYRAAMVPVMAQRAVAAALV